jgi:hypothetical protein
LAGFIIPPSLTPVFLSRLKRIAETHQGSFRFLQCSVLVVELGRSISPTEQAIKAGLETIPRPGFDLRGIAAAI